MSRRKKIRIPGVSFSAKRALGVTKAKRRVARITGIPTSRSGRQRKAARIMGCTVPTIIVSLIPVLILIALFVS